MKSRFWIPLAIIGAIIGAAAMYRTGGRPEPDLVRDSDANTETSLKADQFEADRRDAETLEALRTAQHPTAVRNLAEGVLGDSAVSVTLLLETGNAVFERGMIGLAGRCFQRAVNDFPDSAASRRKLGRLLYCTGQVHRARDVWTPLLRTGGLDLLTLPMFGNQELSFGFETAAIRKTGDTNDPTGRLAMAWRLIEDRHLDQAFQILSGVRTTQAASDHLRHLWALCLSLRGDSEPLARWFASPESVLDFATPGYLCLQGDLCRSTHRGDQAVRCFADAFRLDPNCRHACVQLAELLSQAGQTAVAERLFRRAEVLQAYATLCRQVHVSDDLPSAERLQSIIAVCQKLNCLREALAWCTISKAVLPEEDWMIAAGQRFTEQIAETDRRYTDLTQLQAVVDKVIGSPPDWEAIAAELSTTTESGAEDTAIRFHDVAIEAGIDFVYENGQSLRHSERHFFDFTGGGVAVFDLDCDGYPDLFFSQGGAPPSLGRAEEASMPEPTAAADLADHLYRNRRGQKLDECGSVAQLTDRGYSQGCTAGDLNHDGFSDLYVANIGPNQLYQNNGDGTFTVIPLPASAKWTTSCAIADLTGDGIPDIYDVNHVTPTGIHQQMCRDLDRTWPCDLSQMHAEQDTLLAGNGAGGFEDMTHGSGIEQAEGIGLGLAIADFDQSGELQVFVANDARANFLFHRSVKNTRFEQSAMMRGLALSAEGRAQACMGVAVGDADQDGRADLFVTNFFADYNTLYRQEAKGYFHDASAESGMLSASYRTLGFGTQFLDADLDGDQDLVITNGDVADFSEQNSERPYRQPSQCLQNNGSGNFVDVSAQAGDYFARPVLGRGLARLDWNADGRADFVVSHMGSTAALLENRSAAESSISVNLVGTKRTREPIGAIVTYQGARGATTQQLTAGDGYHARNQAVTLFAVAGNDSMSSIQVVWPSGQSAQYEVSAGAREILIVEWQGLFELER